MKTIQVSKKFRVKSEELWRVISAKENLNLYHPFCKSNVALNWPGKDSIDESVSYTHLTLPTNREV